MMNNFYTSQQMYQNRYSPLNPANNMTWVQGIEGAKAWQLTPNSTVVLFDSENDKRFYIKTSDQSGMCNLRRFNYVEEFEDDNKKVDLSDYVKKSELQDLLNSMLGGSTNEPTVSANEHKGSLIQ